MREQWNNGGRVADTDCPAHKKAHAPTIGGKRVRIWDGTAMGIRPSLSRGLGKGQEGLQLQQREGGRIFFLNLQ